MERICLPRPRTSLKTSLPVSTPEVRGGVWTSTFQDFQLKGKTWTVVKDFSDEYQGFHLKTKAKIWTWLSNSLDNEANLPSPASNFADNITACFPSRSGRQQP
jgi:hypothetical protein